MKKRISIDRARVSDAPELARLAGQLGYPVSPEDVAAAIARMGEEADEAIIVARDSPDSDPSGREGPVVGWTSVSVVRHFYTPTVAEISGFVVDEALRGSGIGTLMMAEAERWAGEAGCPSIRLRANAVRLDAHRFYQRLGFSRTKQQFVFVKKL
jgi:GNAT superfamily N-acetyltransferase